MLQELGNEDLSLLWVGGQGGMEADLVNRAGLRMAALPAAGLHGVGLRALPGNTWLLGRGWLAARRVLAEFRPDVLFFTGGFVAAPVALAGRRIPSLAFVPDIKPGFTLRLIARFADVIAVVAAESRQFFRRAERVQVTGYPVRNEIRAWSREAAQDHFGLSPEAPTLLVFGGSKGARSINEALIQALPVLLSALQIIHITGEGNWEAARAAQSLLTADLAARYHAFPYLHDDMGAAFAAADLALCRAGASTLGELPLFGLPAVLVPIPLAGHLQSDNAAYLEKQGAALVLKDQSMHSELVKTVTELVKDKARLSKMSQAMSFLAAPDAAKRIAVLLRQLGDRRLEKGARA